MINNPNMTKLFISIKSKEKNLFNGLANTVTSINERGIFDILPFHTNFITLVTDYVIVDKGLSTEQKFQIDKGVLYVLSNKVDIHVGI